MTLVPEFDAVFNFRDVGGCQTSGGKTVRTGALFRSGHLSMATDADLEKVAKLNIKHVFDLRDSHEQQSQPNRLPLVSEVVMQSLPVWPVATNEIEKAILDGKIREFGEAASGQNPDTASAMQNFYMSFIRDNLNVWSELFHHLSKADSPALIHCAGGKDRTGIASAILLRALDVPDEVIFEDYLATNAAVDRWIAKDHPTGLPEFFLSVMRADLSYLQSAFTAMEEDYGSFEKFLLHGLDLKTTKRDALKRKFLI